MLWLVSSINRFSFLSLMYFHRRVRRPQMSATSVSNKSVEEAVIRNASTIYTLYTLLNVQFCVSHMRTQIWELHLEHNL